MTAELYEYSGRINQQSDVDSSTSGGSLQHPKHQTGRDIAKLRNTSDATLPKIEIVHGESWLRPVAAGAIYEIVHHPLDVVAEAITGSAIGLGAAALAPELLIGTTVLGAAYGGYELYSHSSDWIRDAHEVSQPQNFSTAQLQKAREDLHGLGRGITDTVISSGGGAAFAVRGVACSSAVDAIGVGLASAARTILPAARIRKELDTPIPSALKSKAISGLKAIFHQQK